MGSPSLLGTGLYTLPEAARIIGTHPGTLRRWVVGYSFRNNGTEGFSDPVITNDIRANGEEVTISFRNLTELLFVNLFRKVGVSLQTIRAAAAEAARRFGTDHPFAVERFDTDGKHIFITLSYDAVEGVPRAKFVEDLNLSQMVIDVLARPYFKNFEYGAQGAVRYYPLGQHNRVVLDPHRWFGKPIDGVSGVPTRVLYEMARSGEKVAHIAKWYHVDEEAVSSAIEYETSLLRAA